MSLLLVGAVGLTFVAIFLEQALRRHRLPNHDFLFNIEMVDPSIYDAAGRWLLAPTILAWLGVMILWFAVLVR